ncbi:thioester reductase domain-containing protein [Apiospora saccharicola]
MTELTFRYPEIHPVFQRENASCCRLAHMRPDELAEAVPEYVLFSYAVTSNPRDGFVDISARCFANSINRASWYLLETLGEPKNFESVGYYGKNDLRYFIFMLAAIKVGYTMVYTSPRNNLDGHLNVLEKCECGVFLLASAVSAQVQPILAERPMRAFTVPELEWFLEESLVEPYPYTKTFEEARHDPCVVLHTTGSTGLPKPVVWKNAMLSTYEAWRTIPDVDGFVPTIEVYQTARRVYTSLPMYHTSGLNAAIIWTLSLGVTLVFGGAHVIPNADYVDEVHRYADVEGSMGAPSLYEDLCAQPKMLVHMRHLHYVVSSGGKPFFGPRNNLAPLSRAAGDQISKYSRVIGNLGATETACLPRLCPSMADWQYFYWHPTHSGIEMREHVEGMYELVIVRDRNLEPFQGVFYAYPELEEWPMNDLYDRHPTQPSLWRYRGRKDHVIVFSNGEKVVPVLMEAALTSSPMVKGGHGHPPEDDMERRTLIQELRHFIEDANTYAPAHAQLDHHHILFTDPSRPIHYLGQGKIQRQLTYNLYEDDIIAAYNAIEKRTVSSSHIFTSVWESVDWLRRQLMEVAGKELEADDDLFKAGVDSLHVMKLAHEIGGVSPSAIYRHPTLRLLATFLVGNASDDGNRPDSTDALDKMESLLRLYTAALPRQVRKETRTAADGTKRARETNMRVVLTGSTGSLGSYLLDALYHSPQVAGIVCLNRGTDSADRQRSVSAGRGLTSDWDESRIQFLEADLSAPLLGLYPAVYQRLQTETTHVIHNQWPVNFHWPVACFEPHIRGVRNLVDLCLVTRHDALLFFVSSVSTVGAWPEPEPVPEVPVRSMAAAAMGYGQAKLVSEQILERAAAFSGLRAVTCRIGVVAGPVDRPEGLWNRHEYIPALTSEKQLINSSAYLDLLPEDFPGRASVDWLPVDKVATILLEILGSHERSPEPADTPLPVFHVSNPNTIPWASPHRRLEESSDESLQDVEKNPAAKLTDFYERIAEADSQVQLETWRAENASETLRATGPVNAEWVSQWMRQWGLSKIELVMR